MTNVVFGYLDRVAGGLITAGSAVAGTPAANVGTAQPGQLWRGAAGVTSTHLLVDFGASYDIGAVLLSATNLTPAATWRVRLSTVDATGVAGNAHDSTTIAAGVAVEYGLALRIFSSPATGRYLRVDLTDASLPYLQAGILRALTKFQLGINFQFGAQRLHRDYSRGRKGWDGQDWILRGSQQRGVAITLPAVTTSEWQAHGEPMLRLSGQSLDVLVCLDPASSNLGRDTYFGLLEELPAWEMFLNSHLTAAFTVWHRI